MEGRGADPEGPIGQSLFNVILDPRLPVVFLRAPFPNQE